MNTNRILSIGLFGSLVLLLGFGLDACRQREEVQPVQVTVQLQYPSEFSEQAGEGIAVRLENTSNGMVYESNSTNAGIAVFAAVLPGTYNISATISLDATQAQNITGVFNKAVTLNAAQNGARVTEPQNSFTLTLRGAPSGGLVIKEVYYTGSRTPSGGNYFSDQFVEIYNNSDEVIFLDGLYIADVWGVSGQINPSSQPTDFQNDPDNVYVNSVWQIPGSGQEHPIEPGKSIIIAQDGINHRTDPNGNPNSPVDLSNADWETYNERPDNRDIDSPTVPNLVRVYFTGGFDWLLTVFGSGVIIFRVDDFATLEEVIVPSSPTLQPRVKVPNGAVIDAFETLQNAESSSFKRIPVALDAGFTFATGTYTSESVRRKTATTVGERRVLQDFNNSTQDFQLLSAPTPRRFD